VSAQVALRLPATVQQHVFASAELAARALAQAVAAKLREGLQRRGRASLIVPGGRTPALFLDQLAIQDLAWPDVIVSPSDDRMVAADHADSNQGTIRRHLLKGAAASAQLVSLVDVALDSEQQLSAAERALASMPRPVDAAVLGMGEDGHTASLFPGAAGTADALDVGRPRLVARVNPAEAPHSRISLTLRALLDARAVMILIQGERKRVAIERAAASDPAQHPIAAFLRQATVPVHLYFSQ
jgi:6-phosphogluconolactonase